MGSYIGAVACLLIGSLTLLYLFKILIETVVFLRAATATVATVIRLDQARSSDGHRMYLPVFEYRTGDGSVYQHTSKVASSPPAYNLGDTATLLYLRRNPRNARLKSFTELWLSKLVVAGVGLSFCFAAFFIFMTAK